MSYVERLPVLECQLESYWRPLAEDEKPRANYLLATVESSLRTVALQNDRSVYLLNMLDDPDYQKVYTSVVCDVVARALMTSTNQEPMTQMSESAGGYSASGTFLVPGGGLFIKKAELARLGLLRRQKVGVIDFYGNQRDSGYTF